MCRFYCWIFDSPKFYEQAARYDDMDDLMSIASAGVSLDSRDSEGRTGCYCHMLKLLSCFD